MTGEHTFAMTRDMGQEFIPKSGTTWGEKVTQMYTISNDNPHQPEINIRGQTTFTVAPSEEESNNGHNSPEETPACNVFLEYDTKMTSSEKYFHLFHHIRAINGDQVCFEKSWAKDVERFFV